MRNVKRLFTSLNLKIIYIFLLLILILAIFGVVSNLEVSPEGIQKLILDSGRVGIVVFLALQALQVIIFVLPGEVFQIAGGYIYGSMLGAALSLAGITLGSISAFLLGRWFGNSFLDKILPEKQFSQFKSMLTKTKNELIIFLLYLLPGFPKDILGYISGISPISFGRFVLITTIARIPAIIMVTSIGSSLDSNNYTKAVVISIGVLIIMIAGLRYKDIIINLLEKSRKR